MKKLSILIAIVLMTMLSTLKADTFGKQNYAGINPFGLVFSIYSGEYGRFLDADGKTEINVPFYATLWNDFNAYGLGAKYRIYKDGNGEGIFYGGGLKFNMVKWDFNWGHYETNQAGHLVYVKDDESSTWMTFTPLGEAGYRWSWANGWTVAPSLELGYDISTYDGNDGWSDPDYGASGLHWGLNLGVCYMF